MPTVTERNPGVNGSYYTDDEVADLLRISLGRLRNKLCTGNPLPPRIEPPGCRHRLWPYQAFYDWLGQFAISVVDKPRSGNEPRRRGFQRWSFFNQVVEAAFIQFRGIP